MKQNEKIDSAYTQDELMKNSSNSSFCKKLNLNIWWFGGRLAEKNSAHKRWWNSPIRPFAFLQNIKPKYLVIRRPKLPKQIHPDSSHKMWSNFDHIKIFGSIRGPPKKIGLSSYSVLIRPKWTEKILPIRSGLSTTTNTILLVYITTIIILVSIKNYQCNRMYYLY